MFTLPMLKQCWEIKNNSMSSLSAKKTMSVLRKENNDDTDYYDNDMMITMLTMMTWWQEASQTIDRMEYLFYLLSWDTSKCCAVVPVWTLVASARPACGLTQNGEMTEYWAVVAVVWVLASGGSLRLGPSNTTPCLPIYACRHGTLNFLSN